MAAAILFFMLWRKSFHLFFYIKIDGKGEISYGGGIQKSLGWTRISFYRRISSAGPFSTYDWSNNSFWFHWRKLRPYNCENNGRPFIMHINGQLVSPLKIRRETNCLLTPNCWGLIKVSLYKWESIKFICS